ncbi:ribose-5-phosphate isomerase [Brachionus plicatilis]|uniref:ribose-5-phosphate isomerase n=1 Tax=Brachionus plicatilis TaxID=10195 RepID=A0A3M7QS29_BRAPC|nr:ribose-5-phosphate isomerase [Brachionus plicatilis]
MIFFLSKFVKLFSNIELKIISKNSQKYLSDKMSSQTSDFNLIEKGKQNSAQRAVDENIDHTTKIIGIGSGSTIVYAVERLAQRVNQENLDIYCIPSSFQAKQLLTKYNLKIADLETFTSVMIGIIDVTIDGADEVDKDLTCIKGGGGCHLQEKLIAFCAKKFIVIADFRKNSTKLGQNWSKGIPIEVLPSAYRLVQDRIQKLYEGSAVLREFSGPGRGKAGPVITDNGNFILDWIFNSNEDNDWKSINQEIKLIPGVIETGLFIGLAKMAYFGNSDGTVTKISSE